MEKWEYGYMYIARADETYGAAGEFFAVADASGTRLLTTRNRLNALNFLGAEGWIISDSRDAGGGLFQSGWMYDLIKQENPKVGGIRLNSSYFMRRPST